MKKVLIIAYYWPPSGGGGVFRILKLVKYIRNYGWEPIVYTAEGNEHPVIDESLENEIPEGVQIIRRPIWEPYKLYKIFSGRKSNEKVYSGFISEKGTSSLRQKISIWIRSNFFIPDARKFWIKPSVAFLQQWLEENKVDAIISSGPPHSCHLIAMALRKKTGIPWMADFRDPWTNIDYYQNLRLSKWANEKHHQLERQVLQTADVVDTVSWRWAADAKEISGRPIEVITNGYDPSDFSETHEYDGKIFSFTHVGSINDDRSPVLFWKTLSDLIHEHEIIRNNFQLNIIGPCDHKVREQITTYQLGKYTKFSPYVPHNEIAALQSSAAVLLLLVNNAPSAKGMIPGKLFEYLAAKRPILSIGDPDSDSAKILSETSRGNTINFSDETGMKSEILRLAHLWKQGDLNVPDASIARYSRENIAEKFAESLTKMVEAINAH